MKTYLITITEPFAEDGTPNLEHYRRRVELLDIAAVLQRIDQALNVKVRAPRSDKGQKRDAART